MKMNNVVGLVRFKTGSRDIHATDVTGALELDVDHGDLEITQTKTWLPKMDIHTRNGDVTLTIPEKASFDLDGTTHRGDLNNEFGDALTTSQEGQGGTVKGRVG
jgi:hypothetical protein